MTVRVTVVLAAILAAMVAYLLATARHPDAEPIASTTPLVPPTLDPTSIRISLGAQPVFEARRGPTGWDHPRAAAFTATLASLPVISVIETATVAPLTYGFGPDAVRLRLANAAAAVVEIEVGALNPSGTGVYVRRSDGPAVLLTGSLLRWELEKLQSVTPVTSVP